MTIPRILVVEDNPDLRTEIVDYLNFCHYKTDGVGTLTEMHSKLSQERWNLLLLDIGLPDGSGLTTAQSLRREFGLRLGIIMVTARGHVEDRIQGLNAGADAYLVKPINLQELKVTIDRLAMRLSDSNPSNTLRIPDAQQQPASPQWQLDSQALQLICPNTRRVPLTVTESLLLKALLEQPGQPVGRDTLCDCLPPGSNKGDTRRLDSILSRLRSKAEKESGIRLPIHTLRNQGYTFAGNRRSSDKHTGDQ